MFSILSPVSSSISFLAASSKVSPNSKCPPGGAYCPDPCEPFLLPSNTSPLSFRMYMPSPMCGRGPNPWAFLSIIFDHLSLANRAVGSGPAAELNFLNLTMASVTAPPVSAIDSVFSPVFSLAAVNLKKITDRRDPRGQCFLEYLRDHQVYSAPFQLF